MTISSTTRKAGPFSGTGAQTDYPFMFKVFTADDMLVVLTDSDGVETTQALTTNYTVALNDDQNVSPGGTITMLVAPPTGYLLTVGSAVLPTQGQSIPNMGGFYPKVIENALDKLTISVQQIAESAARSFKLAFSDTGSANLPAAAARANKLLSFDADGNPVTIALADQSATALQFLLAEPSGGEAIGYRSRLVADRLDDLESVFNFIPKSQHAAIRAGTSVYDASAVIQAALDAGKRLMVPAGLVIVAKNLTSVANGALVCPIGRAQIKVPAGAGLVGITINTPFVLDGIDFNGGAAGPYNVSGAVAGTRSGVVIGNPFDTGTQVQGVTFKNSDVTGFDNIGVRGRETVIGFSFGKRVVFDNVNAHHNFANWWLEARFEYATITNCYGYEGFAGIIMIGGNNTVTASHFEQNFQNGQMSGGENNAHGQFNVCSFNHAVAGGYGLYCLNVTNGHVFNGCAFWFSPIYIDVCTGIFIRNGQIAYSAITINGGGLNGIDCNHTPVGLTKTFIGFTFTSFRGNRISATDATYEPVYGDAYAKSVASSFAYPIAWNAVVDTLLPLVYGTQKWHGETATFLQSANNFYVPRTGLYQIDARILFTVMAADEKVTLKVVLTRAGIDVESSPESRTFKAAQTECVVSLNMRMLAQGGDIVKVYLRTLTATGISIPADGIRVQINSID